MRIAHAPVTAEGCVELLYCLREQAVSRTTHRCGNVPLGLHDESLFVWTFTSADTTPWSSPQTKSE